MGLLRSALSLDAFKKSASAGKVNQARTPEQDLNDVISGDMPATDFDLRGYDPEVGGLSYEAGELTQALEDAGLHVVDDRMGRIFVGQSKEDVDRLMNASNPYEYGKAYGYSDDDIAAFYKRLRGDNDEVAYQEFLRDMQSSSDVESLVMQGFPESTARKIVSGELPMDIDSRMDRAMDQGFDVDTRYYHGTDQDILEFDPELIGKGKGKTPSALPQGFYFSRKPDVASEYATGEGANVIPVFLKTEDMMTRTDLKAFQDFNAGEGDSLLSASGDVMIIRNPEQIRSFSAAFDPDEVNNPNIMASPASVGAVSSLLATEAATPEGQLNPLLAVPAEVGAALNEAVVGTVDFLVPDTVNAVSELIGSEYRMPRLSDQELVRRYTQGGYMEQGVPRDVVRTATGLLSPL